MTALHDQELRARLLKVLRLARQGIGGEKENAEALLAKMLRRHGLTVADLHNLEGEPRTLTWLAVADDFHVSVLAGLIGALLGGDREMWATGKPPKKIGVNATPAEAVSLTIAWEVYVDAWNEAKKDLCLAFLIRHRLFDPNHEQADPVELTPKEAQRILRARAMTEVLEHVERPGRRIGRSGP